jgi:hypothetical protein
MTMARARQRTAAVMFAFASMAHVGSPDTFFTGQAGPYNVRISVRLPGVIPGRAQVAVRVVDAKISDAYRVSIRAGQWNVGLKGAPPPEFAVAVPGDPALYSAELWFMTASSYQLHVAVDGPSGAGTAVVPVMALATAERTMPPWLGTVLAGLGIFLTAGLLTIIGAAVRESVLPPGLEPDPMRRRRARLGVGAAAIGAVLVLWGGSRWWSAEAASYASFVLYRPFATEANLTTSPQRLTLSIRDSRWTGTPLPVSRYNALLPDHGKLMHLFLVRETLDAVAHLHPLARTPQALDFDAAVPSLPPGHYRVYADIVHESGYAQTLVNRIDVPANDSTASTDAQATAPGVTDADDSWFRGAAVVESEQPAFPIADGSRVVWQRGAQALTAGKEAILNFSVRDASGATVEVEPYMGMAAHVIVANPDGSVFAHLHPSGSISMAAYQKFTGGTAADVHDGHTMQVSSAVSIPYAFPKKGSYRMWVQVKRAGMVQTAAFDVEAR